MVQIKESPAGVETQNTGEILCRRCGKWLSLIQPINYCAECADRAEADQQQASDALEELEELKAVNERLTRLRSPYAASQHYLDDARYLLGIVQELLEEGR